MSWCRAILFEENGVSRFPFKCPPHSAVSIEAKAALREESDLLSDAPLLYFKLENFVRDPASGIPQRLFDAFPAISKHPIKVDDFACNVWPDGPDITSPPRMHMLVIPEDLLPLCASIASLAADLRVRYGGATARHAVAKRLRTLPSPSACPSDPQQLFEHPGILAGRPFGRCGPPTSIFDTHLAGLNDVLHDLPDAVPVPSSTKIACALEFLRVSIHFYGENENAYDTPMEDLLRALAKDLFRLNNGWWHDSVSSESTHGQGGSGSGLIAYGLGWIYVLKPQKGVGGDPEVQAIAEYAKLLADNTTMYGKIRDRTRLPTILIAQAGPQLTISVAVYAQTILVDHLLTVTLRDEIDVAEQVLKLARLATCVGDTLVGLRRHYEGLQQAASASLETTALHLPAPASAIAPHAALAVELGLQFLYKVSRITGEALNLNDEIDVRENTRHMVFVALGSGLAGIPREEVVVKFTTRYNATAHAALAALGLAPKLYYHGAVRGGLQMVVMEKIAGCTAFRWMSLTNALLPGSVYADVEAAVKELHSRNLVFGDLRLEWGEDGDGGKHTGESGKQGEANAESDLDSGIRALLIDFDWAAEDGVGRYPATISTLDEFDPAVAPYGVMTQAHDLYALRAVMRSCDLPEV
ncbi:hypothetical protein MSAN_00924200 [Mycena sanguinolenta]|uniref:Uncharacterized protein n=1 Tax=Mycena sanguinolenta TaxID=230812 RepID=A0A8H6YT14_9AGAR|nr:hypothetical protein MSAN_00924200 [Mycena sanguinolenta]